MIVMGNFKHIKILEPVELETVELQGTRHYKTPVGIFPSVTTVTGWQKQKFFSEWRSKNPEESKRVCDRGTKLHQIIEKYLNNEQVQIENSVTEYDLFRLMKPKIDKISNIHAIELPLWSNIIGLAGRVDCIGEYERELSVIDFKGSTKPKLKEDIENYFTQATAYALMWQDLTGEKCNKIRIIMASERGTCQLFEEKVINFVKPLKKIIKSYKKYTKSV